MKNRYRLHRHHHHSDHHDHVHDHHHDDDYDNEYDVYPEEFLSLYNSTTFSGKIIDVRDNWEYAQMRIENSVSVPLRDFPEKIPHLAKDETYYILCSQGFRSSFAAEYLLSNGFAEVYNIQTGIIGIYEYLERSTQLPSWFIRR